MNDSDVVARSGNVPLQATAEADQGQLAADFALSRMVLLLSSSSKQQLALDALLESQHDPSSALYQKWLTPAEYAARFAPNGSAVLRVRSWLMTHGFRVEEPPPSGNYLVFSGSVAQVEEAFHTPMHRYTVEGVEHVANATDPSIPAALAGSVAGVVSLHNFRRSSSMRAKNAVPTNAASAGSSALLRPLYSAGGTHYLFPADFATIYNTGLLASAGLQGAGVSIAIAGRSNVALSDVAAFRSMAGLAVNQPKVVLPAADPGLGSADQDEATLDVEWAGAVAPAAAIMLVAEPSSTTTDGIDLAAAYIVSHALAPIVSVSYNQCEAAMGTTEMAFYNSLWKQAASQGMSVFVSSGDSGAADCQKASASKGLLAAVNGMCSSPYATCVGGTEFNEGAGAGYWLSTNSDSYGSAAGYIPEQVWNESSANGGSGLWASGGGVSSTYAQPGWQSLVAGASAANGKRAVPDVALASADHDGAIVYVGGAYTASGTSVAAPAMAGLMALVVEHSGQSQGNVNPALYALANAGVGVFHPTPAGSNGVAGVSGYVASGATYNLATGLGSMDAAQLVANWPVQMSNASATADFALAASANALVVEAGSTVSFTLAAASTGTARHTVALSANSPGGVAVGFASTSLQTGATTTVTVSVAAAASPGLRTLVLSGTDGSGTQSLSLNLTVSKTESCATEGSGLQPNCAIEVLQ